MDEGAISFGGFRLDPRRGELLRGNEEVRLRPKAWEVLRYLVERRGEIVTLDDLLDHCWKDLSVSFQSVTNVIYSLRAVLAEHGGDPEWIRSIPRRGYRFSAEVEQKAKAAPAPKAVAAAGRDEPRLAADAASAAPLFVGRRSELAYLRQRWQRALEGDPQLVFVSGEPGVGKTTLVRRFCAAIEQDAQVCVGGCIPQQREAEPYMPVLEAVGSLPAMKEIVEEAGDDAPTWLLQMPWLVSREERAALRQSLSDVGPARMLREGKRLLSLLAERSPLLLVLEDVHWADTATADLIRSLAQAIRGPRAMVIATYRSSELIIRDHPLRDVPIELSARHSDVGLLPLDSLPRQAVAEYLERRFGDAELSAQIAPLLEAKSGGNPLFLEALASWLCEQGRIARLDDKWQVTAPLGDLDVGLPAGLREMVRVQLRQLSREHVRLLEAASAAGTDFNTLELAAALEISPAEAEEACRELAGHGHIIHAVDAMSWPDGSLGEAYQFAHATYHQAIREDTPLTRRRALHARIGTRLASAYGRRVREISPRLAAHFEAAGDLEQEFEYLKHSVQLASGRYAHRETLAYIERTLEVLRQLPPTEERAFAMLGWQTERSDLIMDWRGFAAGYESFAQVRDLARAQNNSFLEYAGLVGCSTSALFGHNDIELARREADAALAIAKADNPQLLSLAHIVAGCVSDSSGDPAGAVAHAEAALAALPDSLPGIPRGYDIETFIRVLLSGNLTRLGHFDRGRQERALAIDGAMNRSRVGGRSYACAFMACDALVFREPELALDLAERAIVNGQESGFDHFVFAGEAAKELASSILARDEDIDPDCLARVAAALEKRRRLGEKWYSMLQLAYLADAWRRLGELDQARTIVAGAFDDAEPVYLPEIWRIKGEIEASAAARGPAASRGRQRGLAAECFRTAIEMARSHGSRLFELRTATALARLLDGKEGSREALAQVHAGFSAGVDSVDLRSAAGQLERLAGA